MRLKDEIENIEKSGVSREEKRAQINRAIRNHEIKRARIATTILPVFLALGVPWLFIFSMQIGFALAGDRVAALWYWVIVMGLFFFGACAIKRFYGTNKVKIKKRYWTQTVKKEIEEIEELYDKLCEDVESELYITRKKYYRRKLLLIANIIVSIVLFIYGIGTYIIDETIGAFLMLFVVMLFYNLEGKAKEKKEQYTSIFRKSVTANFMKQYDPELKYDEYLREETGLERHYRNTCFEAISNNNWYMVGDDYVEMTIKENVIKMADINCIYVEPGENEYEFSTFKGKFAIIDYNQQIPEIIIRARRNLPESKVATTISKKFGKYFWVDSTTKEDAVTYLGLDLLNKMVAFRELFGIDIDIIFGNKIYIRFYSNNILEPKVNGKLKDKNSLVKMYAIMNFIIELAERF